MNDKMDKNYPVANDRLNVIFLPMYNMALNTLIIHNILLMLHKVSIL